MFHIGSRVVTEYGTGVVAESSERRTYIVLDGNRGGINVVTGTPGHARLALECIRECGRPARPGEDDCQPCADELERQLRDHQ